MHLQVESQAVQVQRQSVEGTRDWQCQTHEEQGEQEDQIPHETGEDPQTSRKLPR